MNLLLSSLFFAVGCFQKTGTSEAPVKSDLPKWVIEQPELCGVGIAPVMDGELGQAKTYAEDEGRNDLSRQIETKVGSMIKKYNQQTSSGGETISETQRTNVSQSLSKTTLNGSVPKKAHYSEKQEKYYSLICLKPGVFSSAFDAMEQMSEKQRNAIRERAKEAEQELDDALKSYDDM